MNFANHCILDDSNTVRDYSIIKLFFRKVNEISLGAILKFGKLIGVFAPIALALMANLVKILAG